MKQKNIIYHLARICACTALGKERSLEKELKVALSDRISITIIKEAILQCYLFAGFPRAINGLWVLDNMICREKYHTTNERKAPKKQFYKVGRKLCMKIYGGDYLPMMSNMKGLHPDIADWILTEGYGKVLSRRILNTRIRELLVVATLTAMGLWRQLPSHINGAINVGAKKREIEIVIQSISNLINSRNAIMAKNILANLDK